MCAPLTAKVAQQARARVSVHSGRICSKSLNRADTASSVPIKFSQTGCRTDGTPVRLRRRSWSSTAASPMAATTTTASGLKNALRFVKSTTTARTPHSKPEAITVQRRDLGGTVVTVGVQPIYTGLWVRFQMIARRQARIEDSCAGRARTPVLQRLRCEALLGGCL